MANKKKETNFIFGQYLTEMMLFLVAIFVATVWINHHFASSAWFVAGMYGFGILYGFFGLLFKMGDDGDPKKLKTILQNVLLFFLKPVCLFLLYVLILGCCNLLTTIHFYGLPTGPDVETKIKRDNGSLNSLTVAKGEVRIVPVFTNPFGRSLTIGATGYRDKPVEIYPWVATRIHLDSDLAESPSVLFRITGDYSDIESGKFVIKSSRDSTTYDTLVAEGSGSLLIGKRKLIPDAWQVTWKQELDAQEKDEKIKASIIGGWKKFVHVERFPLAPGDQVEVTVLSLSGETHATITVEISDVAFQEYLINSIK